MKNRCDFFMDVLTQAYSHLDFDSKLESADAIGSIIRGEKGGARGKEKTA